MKLTIPPNSLIHDRQVGAHRGRVKAGITLIDHNRPAKGERNGIKKAQPGNPIAIGLMGDELLLSPSGELYSSCIFIVFSCLFIRACHILEKKNLEFDFAG